MASFQLQIKVYLLHLIHQLVWAKMYKSLFMSALQACISIINLFKQLYIITKILYRTVHCICKIFSHDIINNCSYHYHNQYVKSLLIYTYWKIWAYLPFLKIMCLFKQLHVPQIQYNPIQRSSTLLQKHKLKKVYILSRFTLHQNKDFASIALYYSKEQKEYKQPQTHR